MKQLRLFLILISVITLPLVGCVTKTSNDELEREVHAKRMSVAQLERNINEDVLQIKEQVAQKKEELKAEAWGGLTEVLVDIWTALK